MKKRIVKMILPVAVFALAITGAFASHADNGIKNAPSAIVQGWLNAAGTCNQSIQCNDAGNVLCRTASNQQVFGKDEAGNCNIELYRASN